MTFLTSTDLNTYPFTDANDKDNMEYEEAWGIDDKEDPIQLFRFHRRQHSSGDDCLKDEV